MKRLLIPLLLLLAAPAHAFTPESGWWWNPDENGRGFNIEIQNNVITIAAYVYQEDGQPVWYLASGILRGYGGSGEPAPYVFSYLDRFENGQCIGCEYTGKPDRLERFAGRLRIDFTSHTTGVITWDDGTTTPIQRHNFALGGQREKMLGEWRMVVDFSSQNDNLAFWSGDALVFDRILTDATGPYFDGYRRFSRFHNTDDIDDPGNAAGDFSEGSGANAGIHTIVVHNSTDPDEWWLAYYLIVGTDRFEGVAEIYCEDESNSACQPTGEGVPVRGWRSASRKFVTDGGAGPNKHAGKSAASQEAGGLQVPDGMLGTAPGGLKSVESVVGDRDTAEAAVNAARRLTDQLRARAASARDR